MTTEPVGNAPRQPEIPSNSHSARQEQKATPARKAVGGPPEAEKPRPELSSIVEGTVSIRKPPWYKRAIRSMIADDATSVGDYLVQDVILPNVKRFIAELIQTGTDRVLFGSVRPRRIGIRDDPRGPVSSMRSRYDRMAEGSVDARATRVTRDQRARHAFNEITLNDRQEAIYVVDSLIAYIAEYGAVSVAELYTLLGETGSHADQRWGWSDLSTAEVKQHRGGWLLDLPAPEPLR